MRYRRYMARGLRARAVRPWRESRVAFALLLLLSFVMSTTLAVSTASASIAQGLAQPEDSNAHGAHDSDAAMNHDAHLNMQPAEAPCDHKTDCKCHNGQTSACCLQSAPIAAIWSASIGLLDERALGVTIAGADNPRTTSAFKFLGPRQS